MSFEYVEFVHYLAITAEVTRLQRPDLYPDFVDKAGPMRGLGGAASLHRDQRLALVAGPSINDAERAVLGELGRVNESQMADWHESTLRHRRIDGPARRVGRAWLA